MRVTAQLFKNSSR